MNVDRFDIAPEATSGTLQRFQSLTVIRADRPAGG